MNLVRMRQFERQMYREQAEALVAAVRQAPAPRRADLLTRGMQAMGVETRRVVYLLLSDV